MRISSRRPDLSIGQWLAIGFGAAGVLLAVLVVFSFASFARINALRRHEVDSIAPRADLADQLEIAVLDRGMAARSFALTGSERSLQAFERASAEVREALTGLESLPGAPVDSAAQLDGLASSVAKLATTSDALINLTKSDSSPEALRDVEARASTVREELLENVRVFAARLHEEQQQARAQIVTAQRQVQGALIGISLTVLCLLGATALVTVRGVRTPALELLRSASRLAAGDFGPAHGLGGRTRSTPWRNELAELSSAFASMALALRGREERLSAGARLSSALASSLDVDLVCEQALEELVGHLGAESGAVFLRAPHSEVFCAQAVRATDAQAGPGTGYELVRQAAATGAPVFGRAGDRDLTVVPMVFQDRVLGAVQLGTRGALGQGARLFLEQSASLLAVSVHNALSHARVQELARQLQGQNEELQSQGEEIQVQNEELQSQNEELAAQRGQLETRSDELRTAVQTLSRREDDYRQLFGHLSEGFVVHDVLFDAGGQPVDYRFLELNPAFERITGFTAAQTVGRTLGEVMPRGEPCLMEKYRQVAQSGQPVRFESYVPELGKHFEVIVFTPRRARLAALFFDVTGRKRAEEELREADQRKNEFLGVLSHELRNPLAPIRTSLYVLDRVAPGCEAAKRAQAVIDRQVGQLSRLIDDLLDITRISRGKVRLQRGGLDLGRLVLQCADDYRPMFAEHEVHFDLRVSEHPLWVDGDGARLAQVVGNLLQNAAKFTPSGGHVSLTAEEDRGVARVRVRDDGVGIPSEMLGRLFEPFVQADQTLARTGGGLGMGLALVKGLVELHGGTVRAASDGLGGGAEFAFELPLEEKHREAAPAPKPSASRKRRVLVIEDNVDAAESLRDALQFDGFQVELAYDGAEGLRRVRELHPDVVLCDIGLPEMNGYEVAKAVRADPSLNEVFLVALTGYALPEDVRRAADAGFQQHLAKPPPIEKLEEVLGGPLH